MRVIYVAGWLRSGTTLLSRMLGSLDGVTAIGEVSGIWGAAAQGGRCSCGEGISACHLWRSALESVCAPGVMTHARLCELADLTRGVLRTRRSPRLASLSAQPRESWPADVRAYTDVLTTLLTALCERSGSDVLVDSSKLPPGLLTLALVEGVQLDVVQIVRDPRAVANSERRSLGRTGPPGEALPGRSVARSAAYWSLANLAIRRYGRLADRYFAIRYEALATSPVPRLCDLARRLDLAPPEVLEGQVAIQPGHVAVGNPHRFDNPLSVIEPDDAWRSELPASSRRLASAISAPARVAMACGVPPS